MKNRTYNRVKATVSILKKSVARVPGGLSAQELHPARALAGTPRSRTRTVPAQDGTDRSRRHADAELAGFPKEGFLGGAVTG